MRIKIKLTIAFLLVIFLAMSITLIANQAILEEAIYSDYISKGDQDAKITLKLMFRQLQEISGSYTEFLAQDSNLNRAAYYALQLDAKDDIVGTLGDYVTNFGFSFLEIVAMNGEIVYASHVDERSKAPLITEKMRSPTQGGSITVFEYSRDARAFAIHSSALIMRKNQPIGILHGGFLLDANRLAMLALDHSISLLDVEGDYVSSSKPMYAAMQTQFIKAALDEIKQACSLNPQSGDCIRPRFAADRQTIENTPLLLSASTMLGSEGLPIGVIVIGHDATAMENELASGVRKNLVIFGVVCLLAISLSFYMSRRMSRPLVELTRSMSDYGKGVMPNLTLLKDDTREIVSLIESFNDMMKKREAAETARRNSDEQVRLLLNSTSEAIFGVDDAGVCIFANGACINLLGLSDADNFLGNNGFEVLFQCNRNQLRINGNPIFLAFEKGSVSYSDREVISRYDNGAVFPIEIHIAPVVKDDKNVGAVITFSDIAERKLAQQKIQKLNEELEQRVALRTRELKDANENLSQSLTQLRETQVQLVQSEKMASLGGLVAGVAHEINTPLGVSVTAASYLEEHVNHSMTLYKDNELTKEDFEKFMKVALDSSTIILKNLNNAANLVRSFKQVAVDQGCDQARTINLRGYLEEILLSLQPQLKKTAHKVEIDCSYSTELFTYPGSLSQIITNLIMNSIIHGFENKTHGVITIRSSENREGVTLVYSDNGQGMSPEVLANIFEPFFTTKRGHGGSGLGMHVVYNIVSQILGGSINCQSQLGVGATFTITIPRPRENGIEARNTKKTVTA